MPSVAVSAVYDPSPEERRRQVAAILAEGVIRYRRIAQLAAVGDLSRSRDTGLEVLSETRLSVSVGLADDSADSECEVNDGRNA